MTAQDLGKFGAERRHATLVALAIEGTATVIDEIVDLHDRILIKRPHIQLPGSLRCWRVSRWVGSRRQAGS